MAHEQNIEDILKLLKESVHDDTSESFLEEPSSTENEPLSEEILKLQLKQQYAHEAAVSEGTEEQYRLDHDFLAEAQQIQDEPQEENQLDSIEATEQTVANEEDEPLSAYKEEEAVHTPEFSESIEEENNAEDLPPWEETVSPDETTILEIEDTYKNLNDEPFLTDDSIEIISSENSSEDNAEDSSASFEAIADEIELEADEFPQIQTTELSELLRDYQSEEDVQSQYFSFSDKESLIEELALEKDATQTIDEDQFQDAVFDLMQQLGCEEELSAVSQEERLLEEILQEEIPLEEKASLAMEENEARYQKYQDQKTHSLISVIVTGLLALILFFYDLIPFLGGEFEGMISHRDYPGAYLMIGFQLVLLSAVFLGKPLLIGIRRIFSLRPDLYSVVSLMAIVNFVYDLTVLISASDALPTFHFLTALMIASVALGEHLLLIREINVFSIYAEEPGIAQFTLLQSEGKHSIAEQMYEGGLDTDKKIYMPISVEFPKGVLTSMRDEVISNRVISLVMLPSVLLALVGMIVAVLMEGSVHGAAITVMLFLFTTLPLNAVAAICIPLCASTNRLQKRGIALTEKKMIDQYAQCDMIVYKDLHLFKKCDTKDTGIVFYEPEQTTAILGALEILYSTIEGPMAEVFAEIPEAYRFQKIRIRRIFRNGIEAFIDQKHILLVGDSAFMQRYGLSFPCEEIRMGRGTLCISLNGKVSAKMSVKYTTEPIFEMLAERLNSEGIQVVIETFDPMIQAKRIASARRVGCAPINVFHKSVSQLSRTQKEVSRFYQENNVGVLATSSRLKLAEALIWSKKLYSIRKSNNIFTVFFCALGAIWSALILALGLTEEINQYWLLLWSLLPHGIVIAFTLAMMPKKNYFSVEKFQQELERRHHKSQKKLKNKLKKEQNS